MKNLLAFCMLLHILLVSACNNKESKSSDQETSIQQVNKKDYISLIISLDTLRYAKVDRIILKEDSLLSVDPAKERNPYYHYFRARKFDQEKKKDSALAEFQKMKGAKRNDEVEILRNYSILSQSLSNGSVVESDFMSKLFAGVETAEKANSLLTYRFYDLLAQAYYQNQNGNKSLAYAALYFANHPFKSHPVIKQRYYDISFLLASQLGDYKKMSFYNAQARNLAKKAGDSLAIARTYDNEAQIYSAQMQPAKALVSSKMYFNYLKKTNNLNDVAYNNLATTFIRNNQADSAIYYYKEGIALAKRNLSGKQKNVYYKGLIDAYKMKGNFALALAAADSAYTIELRNNKAIEAVKVAEMHEKYETEKKDQNILQLKSRNKLNETIIKQQRWGFFLILLIFLGVLSFFYIIYRQQHLREKNKLLKSENQRLNMEQKLLQAQLNPHFIFNAIANLQGLVSSGHIDESVRYLKSFSGLLRGVLEQNRKDFIEIDEEITSLKNYIQLQQMRYANAFEYKIIVDDKLDVNETLIPPMLIQPFVENSIEHGFRNIMHKGLLTISFKVKGDFLVIIVDDNGSGLKKVTTDKSKKQSLAQIIIKERFDLLFTANGQQAQFKVEDKSTADGKGVLVEIIIPIINE